MRGLPFNVTKCQIYSFFDGINIVNEQDGIFMIRALDGRATGYLNLLSPNPKSALRCSSFGYLSRDSTASTNM